MMTPQAAPSWGAGPNLSPLRPPAAGPNPGLDAPLALVIEDDESAADIASAMLRVLGYRTRIAEDGHAALYALSEQPPDLILLDIHLPEMDGVTLLRVARRVSETQYTPVVACSAVYPPNGSVAKVLKELGAERYLSKPFNLAGLREAVTFVHPGSPAGKESAPKSNARPAAAPSPSFRIDEVVARVTVDGVESAAAVQAVYEQEMELRFTSAPPEVGQPARLDITHRVAKNDAMMDVSLRALGAVTRSRKDGKAWIVRVELRASAPEGGLEQLRDQLQKGSRPRR
jgi:CheY-like chemotaxis protein